MLNRLLAVLQVLNAGLRGCGRFLKWLARQFFGDVSWQAPIWVQWLAQQLIKLWANMRANPKRSLLAFGVLALVASGSFAGYRWYQQRPKPVETTYTVTAPELTSWDDAGKINIKPLVVEFADSVAPLKAVDKPVTTGITMSPAISGNWSWSGDRKLVFLPSADWPIDEKISVELDKKTLLAPQVHLNEYEFEFKTAAFSSKVDSNEFYQDPLDPNLKKMVAHISFSHVVDTAEFEKRISLAFSKDAAYLGINADATQFAVTYDKLHLNAYIHSHSMAVPREDVTLNLTLAKGIRSTRGGNSTDADISSSITVPGRFSLNFSNASMTLVDNERFEPEQVLLLESSRPMAEHALDGKITAWVLPLYRPGAPESEKTDPYEWGNTEQIGKEIVAASAKLPLYPVPGDEDSQTLHSFKFQAPVGRYIYVEIKAGVAGIGGYVSGKPYAAIVKVEPYTSTLILMGQGAILSLSGEHKLGFVARGVEQVDIEIGRLMPEQLHHLVDANWGSYTQPQLDSRWGDRLVERFKETRKITTAGPGKPVYDNVDLGNYLDNKAQGKHGIFLLKLSGAAKASTAETTTEADTSSDDEESYSEEDSSEESGGEISDSRLLILTDLGMLVKRTVDGSQDVFVQSISTGLPVAGAQVDVMGRNGKTVQSHTTDATGKAHFAPLSKLVREKTPLMFVVQKDGDLSFLPIKDYSRQLDLSRFDVGGIDNEVNPDTLTAYLFSDRGMYRPGENVHVGAIVRTQNWKASLNRMPVELEVTDPRGQALLNKRMALSAAGFEAIDWSTQISSPTGHYEISMYLIKDGKRDVMLGSTSVQVQEFEPDRMKVTLSLTDKSTQGWVRPEDINAKVKVMHLFGTPATDRRVETEMTLNPTLPSFPKYRDYSFTDQAKLNERVEDKLPDTTTDDNGEATFNLNLQRFDSATYRLSLLSKAFEPEGGRNVAAFNAVLVSSAPYLVGTKTDGDLGYVQRGSVINSQWLAINSALNPIAVNDLALEWVQRKFVSVLIKQDDGTYRYQSRRKDIVRKTSPYKLAAAVNTYALPTTEPGDFSLVLRNKNGQELNRVEYSVVGEANLSRSLDRNAELQLKLDKTDYQPGDTMNISIRAPYTGAGLITIERDKVYEHVWFKTTTTSSVQSIVLPKDFEGNGYISVQFVRDINSNEIFMSPLSYGVTPFAVSLAQRVEPVKLEAAELVKPGTDLRLRVSTGHPSRVVVFAVDEGILQVAGYKKPDPLGFFFQKRALGVRTSQILDLILPEYQKLLNAAAPGGDGDNGLNRHINPFQKKHRPPVAYWSGIIDVPAEGRELHYKVPDYFNGKLRLMAVAVTEQTVGVFEGGTEVRGDLILSPNVPNMIAPGDEFMVSVGVVNNAQGSKGPITLQLVTSRGLTVVGGNQTQLTVAPLKEGVAQFKVRANDVLGAASLKFTARLGAKNATLEESVSVRPAVPFRTQITVGRTDSSSTKIDLNRDLYAEYRSVNAVAGFTPLAWTHGLSAYLADYPYACTEQLVSRGFPALLLMSRPELGKLETKSSFDGLIQTLSSRQNSEGAFGLWSSSTRVDPFASMYAVHFLIEAKERHQNVPPNLLSKANQWLQQVAGPRGNSLADARQRAYAIYLLTRQGVMTSGLLAPLQQELDSRYAKEWRQDLTAAYVASSYQLLQQNDLAYKIMRNPPWAYTSKNMATDSVYYDPLVHDSQLLYLVARHFPAQLPKVPEKVLDQLGKGISSNRYNSLSAAYLLLGLESYATAAQQQGNNLLTMAELDKSGKSNPLRTEVGLLNRAALSINAKKLLLSKDSKLAAFYGVSESGFDHQLANKEVKNGLEIFREYLDLQGKPITQVKVGEEFLAKVSVRAIDRDAVNQIAVVDLLPGGVEPVLNRVVESEDGSESTSQSSLIGISGQSTWTPDFTEIRDDRLILYGTLSKDVQTFTYRLRATNAGVFQSPMPFAESMYDRSLYAQGLREKLTIVKP